MSSKISFKLCLTTVLLIVAIMRPIEGFTQSWWASPVEPRLLSASGALSNPESIEIEIVDSTGRKYLYGYTALVFLTARHYVDFDANGRLYKTDKYKAWKQSHESVTPGHGQIFENIVGAWNFGRVGGAQLGQLTFTDSAGDYGYIIAQPHHPNESYWTVTDTGMLIIRNVDGHITSRLTQVSPNRWEGPYTSPPTVASPASPVSHYIER